MLTMEYFDASYPYYHDAITWCVRKKQPIPRWKNIFYLSRSPVVLTLYILMCLSAISFSYFVQQFEDRKSITGWDWHKVTNIAAASVFGSASNYRATIISNRIFFIGCLFSNMVFMNNVLSFILKSMTSSIYDSQVESVHEIIDGSYKLFGDNFALQHLMKQNEVRRPPICILNEYKQ